MQRVPEVLLATSGIWQPVQEPGTERQAAQRSPTRPTNEQRAGTVLGRRRQPDTSLGGKGW